jgi:cytochrome c biogenesis protein CcmG/thiol:disulfide interchange protein DsbE
MADMSQAYMVDARKLAAGGVAMVIGLAVAGLFVWMTPRAAARETKAACEALRSEAGIEHWKAALPTPARDFTATDHLGRPVKLSDYRGKVVLLNFWASWCNVCKAEKPSLSAMTEEMAQDDFVVVTLASDHAWDPIKKVMPKGAPFQVLLDPPADIGRPGPLDDDNIGAIAQSYGIEAVPESFLIDKKGNIRFYLVNKRDWDTSVAETCIQSLIDE